jgi:hypothetical protein
VNDPPDLAQALAAEERARAGYTADPYSASPFYRQKREERNRQRRMHGYAASSPELIPLFRHQGPAQFAGPLPWREEPGLIS